MQTESTLWKRACHKRAEETAHLSLGQMCKEVKKNPLEPQKQNRLGDSSRTFAVLLCSQAILFFCMDIELDSKLFFAQRKHSAFSFALF